MKVRRRKSVIWLAAALLGAISASVLAWGVGYPVRVGATGAGEAPEPASRAVASDKAADGSADRDRRPPVEELVRLCEMELRRPLYEPEPAERERADAEPGDEPKASTSMTVRLIGTINEPGHSMAMFQKKDGSVELCAEGRSIEDGEGEVTVIEIEHQRVTVRHAGRERELVTPRLAGEVEP